MSNLKDRIKASVERDVIEQIEDVPEWTGPGEEMMKVGIRRVSLQARNIALAKSRGNDGSINMTSFQTSILARTMFDPETHELIFESPEEAHKELKDGSADVIDRLVKIATKGTSDPTEAVDDAGKGSSSTGSADSSGISLSG